MISAEEQLTSALSDRYRIERELGAGGMATVYLAEDVKHHRKVAIKVLHAELSAILGPERFLKEIELTANLQHPHILPLFDSGSANGLLFYVMPFVDGETLRGRLTREKQLPVADGVRIATEVADALEYAHRHGVIHRDVKPEHPPARRTRSRRRFRHRAGGRAGGRHADDADGTLPRHAAVHVTRAGDGRARDRTALGHLLARRGDVRDARRRSAVHGIHRAGNRRAGDHQRAALALGTAQERATQRG